MPADPGIHPAVPVQALTGFALLTAALTWCMQIYPPRSRRRAVALKRKLLVETDYPQEIGQMDAATASRVLNTLAAEVDQVRTDFTRHSEGFCFREQAPDQSLARRLSHAVALRVAADAEDHGQAR